jgi:hypothetical protein
MVPWCAKNWQPARCARCSDHFMIRKIIRKTGAALRSGCLHMDTCQKKRSGIRMLSPGKTGTGLSSEIASSALAPARRT